MRFLLIRFSSLGDILLQTSFASWLKSEFPDCHIAFLTLKGNEALIKDHPHIDEILLYEKKKGLEDVKRLYRFCRDLLCAKKFDLLIDLHGTTRSFLSRCFLPGVQALSMDKRRLERFLLVKTKIDLLKDEPGLHERNLVDLAWAFGKTYEKGRLLDFINKDFPQNRSLITSSASSRDVLKKEQTLVALAPGASFKPKRWPVENFLKLAEMILEHTRLNLIVLGGPEDHFCEVFNRLEERHPDRIKNLQGKLGLGESMVEASKASLIIGNDSLMGHVAESCSIPSFSIFGPTSESFGFAPHLPESRSFSVEDLWCRPCSTTGSKECFRKKQFCMTGVRPEKIFEGVKKLFQEDADAL